MGFWGRKGDFGEESLDDPGFPNPNLHIDIHVTWFITKMQEGESRGAGASEKTKEFCPLGSLDGFDGKTARKQSPYMSGVDVGKRGTLWSHCQNKPSY